jgi:hypothetical protein
MSVLPNISADYDAFRELVMQRPLADKMALVRELEKETFPSRFAELLKRIRSRTGTNDSTPEDIAKEVDAVRSARYSKGN